MSLLKPFTRRSSLHEELIDVAEGIASPRLSPSCPESVPYSSEKRFRSESAPAEYIPPKLDAGEEISKEDELSKEEFLFSDSKEPVDLELLIKNTKEILATNFTEEIYLLRCDTRISRMQDNALKGHVQSNLLLAQMHYEGTDSLAANSWRALSFFLSSVEIDSKCYRAINNIGVLFATAKKHGGLYLFPDYNMAEMWFRVGAESLDVCCCSNLGILKAAYSGKQDFVQAFKLFRLAAKCGDMVALNNLGCLYARGYGTDKDYARSMKYLKRCADTFSCPVADYNIGTLYSTGLTKSGKTDFGKSKKWYDRATRNKKHPQYKLVTADMDPHKLLMLTSFTRYIILDF